MRSPRAEAEWLGWSQEKAVVLDGVARSWDVVADETVFVNTWSLAFGQSYRRDNEWSMVWAKIEPGIGDRGSVALGSVREVAGGVSVLVRASSDQLHGGTRWRCGYWIDWCCSVDGLWLDCSVEMADARGWCCSYDGGDGSMMVGYRLGWWFRMSYERLEFHWW